MSYDRQKRKKARLLKYAESDESEFVAVHLTYVTTYGLKRNRHSGIVQSEVTLDDLFLE